MKRNKPSPGAPPGKMAATPGTPTPMPRKFDSLAEMQCWTFLNRWKPNKADRIMWLATPNKSLPDGLAPIQLLALGHERILMQHLLNRLAGTPH